MTKSNLDRARMKREGLEVHVIDGVGFGTRAPKGSRLCGGVGGLKTYYVM